MKLNVGVLYPREGLDVPEIVETTGENGPERALFWHNLNWATITHNGVIHIFQPDREYLLKILTTGLSFVPKVGSTIRIVGKDPMVFEISLHTLVSHDTNSLEVSENFHFLVRVIALSR
jgi:hypothetical protein